MILAVLVGFLGFPVTYGRLMHVDSLQSVRLLDGVAGTQQTLVAMAAQVRQDAGNLTLRQKALKIVSDCPGHDFKCEIRALFRYCRDQITYRKDPVENEWVQDAARTLHVFGTGDCDDKVVCLATLLATLGHKSRFVIIGRRPDQFSHVYLEVQTAPDKWVPLDPTPERAPAGWEARGLYRETFEIFDGAGGSSNSGLLLFAGAGLLCWWLLK